MTIGERIKARREQLGISQTAFADMVGEQKQTIYKYETGIVTNIPPQKVEAMANALYVAPAYLMGWESSGEDSFSSKFKERLNECMERVRSENHTDDELAAINIDLINAVLNGKKALTLDDACEICDGLGETLDYMLGYEPKDTIKAALSYLDADGLTVEIFKRLMDLPSDKLQAATEYIRYLSASSDKR